MSTDRVFIMEILEKVSQMERDLQLLSREVQDIRKIVHTILSSM